MSNWHKIKIDDVEIDPQTNEVSIYVCNDYSGSVYAVLTKDVLEEICRNVVKNLHQSIKA